MRPGPCALYLRTSESTNSRKPNQTVGFDRAYMYAVSNAPGEGNAALSGPEGLDAELRVVERLWKKDGALAVMHDLANSGRIGDLTVVAPGETIKVYEVKASGGLNRDQIRRMFEMGVFLRGGAKSLEEGYSVKAATSEPPTAPNEPIRWELNSWDYYLRALADAGSGALGWATVEDYLGVIGVNTLHPRWRFLGTASVPEENQDEQFMKAYEPVDTAFREAHVLRGGKRGPHGLLGQLREVRGERFWCPLFHLPPAAGILRCTDLRFAQDAGLDQYD